jgi:NAD(P)-dependent dehydrogenase (short-subunit alcohol dehydrogenase family)
VASKFALGGFSETARAELVKDDIVVTTAYPGFMRTGSPIQAVFKGDYEREFAWFALGDSLPGISMKADRAAKIILNAARDGQAEVLVGWPTKLGVWAHALFPEIYASIMARIASRLPSTVSRERKTGAESRGFFKSLWWTKPLQAIQERAQRDLNQTEKFDADFNVGLRRMPTQPKPPPT